MKTSEPVDFTKGIIYIATNVINGKCYVGQTVSPLCRRISEHMSKAKNGSSTHFHNALRKYGEENFVFSVMRTGFATEAEMDEAEIQAIREIGYYNIHTGGRCGSRGHVKSAETREKISKSLTGRKVSEATKAKKRGKKWSDAQRTALKERRKLIPKDVLQAGYKKTSEKMKGRKKSSETRDRMSQGQKHSYASRGNLPPNARLLAQNLDSCIETHIKGKFRVSLTKLFMKWYHGEDVEIRMGSYDTYENAYDVVEACTICCQREDSFDIGRFKAEVKLLCDRSGVYSNHPVPFLDKECSDSLKILCKGMGLSYRDISSICRCSEARVDSIIRDKRANEFSLYDYVNITTHLNRTITV